MNGTKLESPAPIDGIVVSPRALGQWMQGAVDAIDLIQTARCYVATGGGGLATGQTIESVLEDAEDLNNSIRVSTRAALGIHGAPVSHAPEIDIFQLDTPDTRELLATLEKAQAIAERIDAARGRAVEASVPLGPGESRGTDLAETISMVALRVRGEVHGASGNGLE